MRPGELQKTSPPQEPTRASHRGWLYFHVVKRQGAATDTSGLKLPVEERLGAGLAARGLTLATAESCTGGLVAHRLTSVAGSSAYFLGGVVAYSNELKVALLGVSEQVLREHGAVSAECARAMAEGVRARTGAALGLATTGIAGPGGATLAKPVGLVYIGCATPEGTVVREHHFPGDRLANIRASAQAALDLAMEAQQTLSARRQPGSPVAQSV